MPRPPIIDPFKAPEPPPAPSAGPTGDATADGTLKGLLKPRGNRGVVLSGRCGECGYLIGSPGHKVTCG
jgi:hypothetical protein